MFGLTIMITISSQKSTWLIFFVSSQSLSRARKYIPAKYRLLLYNASYQTALYLLVYCLEQL